MLLSLGVHSLLLLFEVLVCDKLYSGRHVWVLVFFPLFSLSITCIGLSIWALKSTRPFELELLGGVNLLQFIFVALRLDGLVHWQWQMVFIPLWIFFGMAMIAVSYSILLAVVFLRSATISSEQRRSSLQAALGYTSLIVPSFVSLVNSVSRFIGLVAKLALMSLIMRSFSARGGNLWWCGMQKDFYPFLLDMLPSLREYGNVSYQLDARSAPAASTPDHLDRFDHLKRIKRNLKNDARAVVPILIIDVPD
uniref:EOG090X087A n=1 Tax=Evadne anonyx TaxID=141404 RepID=A0A9N6WQ55_9CRUS|nr:EOG090X087A [Evadne anonyx]